jgi:hypothetical protein
MASDLRTELSPAPAGAPVQGALPGALAISSPTPNLPGVIPKASPREAKLAELLRSKFAVVTAIVRSRHVHDQLAVKRGPKRLHMREPSSNSRTSRRSRTWASPQSR